MANEVQEEVQRWTAKRETALVLSILKRETSVETVLVIVVPGDRRWSVRGK